ncbi:MAG: signal peptidase II [Deltaproteobacteria bacterium]|nr:signal peptidase II [Deltaproteobacteria bacterium]
MSKYRTLSIIAAVILVLDQATKFYVDANFKLHETVPVIRGFFHLTYVRNKGAAFGILSDSAIRIPFFITVSIIAMLGILWYIKHIRKDQKLALFSLSLVFSGAFGNLIDRIRFGEVIDFLDVFWQRHHWPAFNVADSAITVGVVLLFIEMWREDRNKSVVNSANKHKENKL